MGQGEGTGRVHGRKGIVAVPELEGAKAGAAFYGVRAPAADGPLEEKGGAVGKKKGLPHFLAKRHDGWVFSCDTGSIYSRGRTEMQEGVAGVVAEIGDSSHDPAVRTGKLGPDLLVEQVAQGKHACEGGTPREMRVDRRLEKQFRLPGEVPRMVLDIGFGPKTLEPVLHTVIIRGEDRQVDLVWRGSQPYPGVEWLAEMKTLEAEVA